MKNKFCLYQRGAVYYAEEAETGNRTSLKTKDRVEAKKLLHAKNEAANQPSLNIAIGRVHLAAADPKLVTRTWSDVMDDFCGRGKDSSRARKERAAKSDDFALIRTKKIVETTPDDFRIVLKRRVLTTTRFYAACKILPSAMAG